MKVKIQLDPRYKDEKKPLVYTLSHKGKRKYLSTGHKLSDDEIQIHDSGVKFITGKAKQDEKNSLKVNIQFNQLLSYVTTNSFKLKNKLSDEAFKLIQVEVFGVAPLDNRSLIKTIGEDYIQRLRMEGRGSTALSYRNALDAFIKFGSDKLRIEDIDYKWLNSFKAQSIKDGRKINTIGIYCRSMKAMIFDAIKQGITEHNPFIGFKIPKEKTRKRNISKEDINKIRSLIYLPGTKEFNARNYFLFMFDCMGMNFLDLATLKVSQYRNGFIIYDRSKTGDQFTIKLNKEAQEILGYYIEGKSKDDYVFPIIQRDFPLGSEAFKLYKNDLTKRLNKTLKSIAEKAGIESKVTTYTARHTWASIARKMGFAIDQIQKGLGHESSLTTETYVSEFDTVIIDEMNARVTL